MNLPRTALKSAARYQLIGQYRWVIPAAVISTVITYLSSFLPSWLAQRGMSYFSVSIASLIISLLTGLLSSGLILIYLRIARSESWQLSDIFWCYSHHPDRAILIQLFLSVLYMGVSMLAITLLSTTVILTDGILEWFLLTAEAIFTVIAAIRINLRFALVWYLYLDHPDWNVPGLFSESSNRMSGHYLRFFCLELSFIGIILLGILTFGLAFLWINPYIGVTEACFYLDLYSDLYPDAMQQTDEGSRADTAGDPPMESADDENEQPSYNAPADGCNTDISSETDCMQ